MARPVSNQMTQEQKRIARAVGALEEKGEPPYVAVLLNMLNLARSASLLPTLKRMERNRYVTLHGQGRGHSTVVQLTPFGRTAIGMGGIPVLGSISAGRLEEAISEADEFLEPRDLISCQLGDFFLRVKGDSMIGDGIMPGDLTLLRPDIQVESGEIAAVQSDIDHEATLKRVLFDPAGKREVTLRASNTAYKDRVVSADVLKIAGVYRGLVRNTVQKRNK
jgi:repressor LexA